MPQLPSLMLLLHYVHYSHNYQLSSISFPSISLYLVDLVVHCNIFNFMQSPPVHCTISLAFSVVLYLHHCSAGIPVDLLLATMLSGHHPQHLLSQRHLYCYVTVPPSSQALQLPRVSLYFLLLCHYSKSLRKERLGSSNTSVGL